MQIDGTVHAVEQSILVRIQVMWSWPHPLSVKSK
jgi:hypothetical protein